MANFGYQLEATSGVSVNNNAPVLFDATPILANEDNIVYDSATGTLTFTNPGKYYVSWFVAVQTGLGLAGAQFGIVTSTPKTFMATDAMKTGQISGFALIDATAGMTLQLKNLTGGVIYYSPATAVKAGLGIVKIDTTFGGIELQTTAQGGTLLGTGATIPYDTTVTDVSYYMAPSGDGGITINTTGIYSIDWWVALEGSTSPGETSFVLKDDAGNTLATSYAVTQTSGMYYGTAILNITASPKTIYLYNNTGGQINLADITVQAGIKVIEVSNR